MALRTYVHISDLHFGTPGAQQSALTPWIHYVPLLNGFAGEDPAALRYLASSVAALRASEPQLEPIVTGDLTAYGSDVQFDRANDYLGLPGSAPQFLGLDFPHWRELAIPGNHDHWPGIPFVSLGGNRHAVRTRFPPTYVSAPADLGKGRELVFVHVDGDVDVKPVSPERFYAVGSFVSGLRQLEQHPALAAGATNQVRVLLLHYSYEYVGPMIKSRWLPIGINLHHLSIDDASRHALKAFIDKFNIRVLLTGHVHNPFFVGDVPSLAPARQMVMEARCGSSSQRVSPHAASAHSSKRFKNTFIVHRIQEDAQTTALSWESEVHAIELSGVGGFQPASTFMTHPAPKHRLQVWPQ